MQTPCSRNSDPITSKLADRHITTSGTRLQQVRLVALIVKRYSGYTCRELAAITGLDHEMIHKRVSESVMNVRGAVVTCFVTGRKAHVWHSFEGSVICKRKH